MSHLRPVVVRMASVDPTGMIPQVGPSMSKLQVMSCVPYLCDVDEQGTISETATGHTIG